MSDHSVIAWCDATWPITVGCTKISPGCDHCYAIRDARRLGGNPNHKISNVYGGLVAKRADGALEWTGTVRMLPERLDWPARWKEPRRIFVCSQSDLFHEDVDAAFIHEALDMMASLPRHTFQLLSKRPGRMATSIRRWLLTRELSELPAHIWVGTSVEADTTAWRADTLKQIPARVRFISAEPLLSALHLNLDGIAWLIIGGESGPGARPLDLAWVRDLIRLCGWSGTRPFVKQLGAVWAHEHQSSSRAGADIAEWPADLQVQQFPGVPVPA